MASDRPAYPEKILPTVRSDIRAYLRHGYSFADFKSRNTHGRNYGDALRPIWDEVAAQCQKEKTNDKRRV